MQAGGRWAPGERKTVWAGAGLVAACGVFAADAVWANLVGHGANPFGDFFALWSYARLVLLHPAARLYDPAWLHQAQVAMGMLPDTQAPFPYPPTFLLLVWPIGLLSFWGAYFAWVGATFCLYGLAICTGARGRAATVAVLVLAPTTAVCVASGQSGFLLAALLVGGGRLMGRRPVLAGVLFGVLTYKPQFGLLVPVALVAAGRWRCIAAACAATAALLALDTVLFGAEVWGAWLGSLPGYATLFDAATAGNRLLPTVLGNALGLGLSHGAAQGVQLVAALLAAAAVWTAWRRPGPFSAPVLLAATCLATPHAFLYDLPMLSAAAVLLARHRLETSGAVPAGEAAGIVAALMMPVPVVVFASAVPVSTLATAAFLGIALAAGRKGRVVRLRAGWGEGRPEALPLDSAGA
ncbi:MAG: glycosyltransferase family 87 protein [Janthinobacterium lividum]